MLPQHEVFATTVVRADGAGLYKRPLGCHTRTNYSSIVAVTRPSQTHTVTMFAAVVTFTADEL